MKLKRNTCEKVEFHVPESLQNCVKNGFKSSKYLVDILHASEGVQQINLLKEIEKNLLQYELDPEEHHSVIDALCSMFYQAPLKSSHRKTLHRIIQEISQKYDAAIELSLQKSVDSITSLSAVNTSIEEIETSVHYIIGLIDNIKIGKTIVDQNASKVWQYISSVFNIVIENLKHENSLQKRNDLYSTCQTILKLVTHSIQSCASFKRVLAESNDEKFQASSKELILSFNYLLFSDETSLNCRLNAAFAYCHYHYFSHGVKKLKDMLSESSSQFKFPQSSQLCILSGIMGVLPLDDFIEDADDSAIAKKILLQNLSISKCSDDSEVLLLCARNIFQWTNLIQNVFKSGYVASEEQIAIIACMFSKDENMMKNLFEYVLHHREHFIDALRHLSKDIFRNILNLHILSVGVESSTSSVIKEMTLFLLKDLPSHSRGKYGMLSCIVERIGTEAILKWHPALPSELYDTLVESSLVSHVSEFFQVLFRCSLDSEDEKSFHTVWIMPMLDVLCKGTKEQTSAVTEHILPKLLQVKSSSLSFLLIKLSAMWENNIGNGFSAFISCMKRYQRKKGSSSYLEFMSSESVMKAFFHADDQVRLSAFALLCENFKTTEPIDLDSFEIIKAGLPYNINCQSPSFRQQLISYMKKLFVRMIESGYAIMKNQQCPSEKSHLSKSMLPELYKDFLLWLKEYLFSCLHPGANFPRRVTSLNLLHIVHKLFSHCVQIVDSEVAVQTLLYSLQDTYDNNKVLALKILSSEQALSINFEDDMLLQTALTLASSTKPPDTATAAYLFAFMVQCPSFQPVVQRRLLLLSQQDTSLSFTLPISAELTHVADFCTILMLMYELKKQQQYAEKSLLEAAVHAPLYGILTCIRIILCNRKLIDMDDLSVIHWQHLIEQLLVLSMNVAYVVEPIVCNSSPEGHLPMDTSNDSIAQLQAAVRRALGCRFQSAVVQEDPSKESDTVVLDIVKTHAVTAQILLLCCWRTHKEVSLLLGEICEKLPFVDSHSNAAGGILHISQVKEIGKYFIYQMSLVKHKGAFEQAYIGFSKLSHRLWRSDLSELNGLPKLWLDDLVLAIKGLKQDIQLCSTRRSAGVPFIVQGLLTPEPSIATFFFKTSLITFLTLAQSSESNSCDVQIHALNVLRALFRDACLGEAVMPFVSDGLKISIQGFKSHLWGVRNSSTLLFSALMTRIFGVNRSHDETGKKNRLTGKSFFSYYRDLYHFLYLELEQRALSLHESKGKKISIQPSLYPILLLLGKLYPAPGEKDSCLSSFIPFLNMCAISPIWKTRSLAAKAFVSFTSHETVASTLQSVIDALPSDQANFFQNKVHGHLLQVLYLLEEFCHLPEFQENSIRSILQSWFNSSFDLYIRDNKCSSTKSAYLEILLFSILLDIHPDVNIINKLYEDLWFEFGRTFSHPDRNSYLVASVSILIFQMLQMKEDHLFNVLHPKTKCNISVNELFELFLQSPHKIVRSTAIEILLWFVDDYKKHKYCSEFSDDIVILQRVIKATHLLDRRKFHSRDVINGSEICLQLVALLPKENDPSFLKQIYKLMSCIPCSVSIPWTFVEKSYSWDLLNKLKYVLNEMEVCCRDEVICQMLMYSTYIIVSIHERFEKDDEDKFCEDDFNIIERWLQKLEEASHPENSILLRETVVSILQMLTDASIFPKSKFFGSCNSYVWQSLLLVLIDDEPEIKYLASEIVVKITLSVNQGHGVLSVVPLKALDLMVEAYVEANSDSPSECISMLLNWMMSSNTDSLESMNDEQPFDKGEMNIFSEDLNLTFIVSKHVSSYLKSQKSPEDYKVLLRTTFWKEKNDTTLKLSDIITLCISEANSIIDCFLTRLSVSPLLDACIDHELLQISQLLSVVLVLSPWVQVQPQYRLFANELFKKIENLNFRTFLIKDIISKIQQFLDKL